MIFVSNRTSRHWDVLFDRTTVDMSTDGRNLARGVPWGAREAMGPVRRAIPGQRVASVRYMLFCSEFHYIVVKVTTCVSNRFAKKRSANHKFTFPERRTFSDRSRAEQ